jgi:hypothetical protein
MRRRVATGGIVGIGLHISFPGFFELAGLLQLHARFFVGLGDARPFLGPELRIFARQVGENRLDIFPFGVAKSITFADAFANHRFDFI